MTNAARAARTLVAVLGAATALITVTPAARAVPVAATAPVPITLAPIGGAFDRHEPAATAVVTVPDGGVAGGSSIIVAIQASAALSSRSCSDSAGNTYATDVSAPSVAVLSSHGVTALDAADTITCTGHAGSSVSLVMVAVEATGLAADPLDDTAINQSTTTATGDWTSTDATLAGPSGLVVGALSRADLTPDPSFTDVSQMFSFGSYFGYKTAASPGPYAFSGTSNTANSGYGAMVATYQAEVLTLDSGLTDDTATIAAGAAAAFTPTVTDSAGQPVTSDPAGWTVTGADGAVDAAIDGTTGEISLSSTTAGTHQLTLTAPTRGVVLDSGLTLVVEPDALDGLALSTGRTTVNEGDTIEITATGIDQFGNTIGDVTADTSFSSNVDSDVVAGNKVTFPTASAHTISGTHTGGATGRLTITVTPAAHTTTTTQPATTSRDTLPATGAATVPLASLLAGGVAAVAAGAILIRARRHT